MREHQRNIRKVKTSRGFGNFIINRVRTIGDIREKVGKEFIIKDGKKVLDTVDLGLHGRMFQSEEQKKTIDDWVVRNLPTKGKHSVTVE